MNETKTLYDYWMICYRKRVSVLLLIAVSVGGAIAISAILAPIYEARTIFYVPASATTKRANTSDIDLPLPTSNQDDAKANIGILKGGDAARMLHERFPAKSLQALRRDVDFTAGRDGLIYVYVRDRDPQLAAAVANGYVQYFNQFMLQRLDDRLTPKAQALKARINEVQGELNTLRLSKMQIEEKAGTPLLDAQAVTLVRDREDLRREREQLIDEGDATKVNAAPRYAARDRDKPDGYQGPSVNRVVDELEKEVALLSVRLAGARKKYAPMYPEVQELTERYNKAKKELDEKLAQLDSADKSRSKNLGRMVEKRNQRLGALPELKRLQEQNEQHIHNLSSELSFLRQNLQEVTYSSVRSQSQGIVVETATPPRDPVFPIAWLNAVIALVLGLATGVMYAFLLDYIASARVAARQRGDSASQRPLALRA